LAGATVSGSLNIGPSLNCRVWAVASDPENADLPGDREVDGEVERIGALLARTGFTDLAAIWRAVIGAWREAWRELASNPADLGA